MKDLKFLHAAHSVPVADVKVLGYRSATKEFRPSVFAGQTVFDVAADTVPELYSVRVGPDTYRRYSGSGSVPDQHFRIITGDVDAIEISPPLQDHRLVITYSTSDMAKTAVVEVTGTGFDYAGEVKIAGKSFSEIDVINSTTIRAVVSTEFAEIAVPANTEVIVYVENMPGTSNLLVDLTIRNRTASGLDLLKQRFMTLLLDPEAGNLLGMIPRSGLNTQHLQTVILNRLNLAVNAAKAVLVAQTTSTDPGEVLADVGIAGISTDPVSGALTAKIRIRAASGAVVTAPVPLGG